MVEINGVPVEREAIGEFVVDFGYELVPAELWRETLPNGAVFDTLDTEPDGFLDNTPDFAVPPGHYFVLGDNRDNANDSRGVYGGMGYVPAANVLGRMDRVLASCKPDGRFLADRTGLAVGPAVDKPARVVRRALRPRRPRRVAVPLGRIGASWSRLGMRKDRQCVP